MTGNFSLNVTTVPDRDNITIYSPEKPGYTRENILSLSKDLNLSVINETELFYTGTTNDSQDRFLTVYKNIRIINYRDSQRMTQLLQTIQSKCLPSDDQAVSVVTNLLTGANLMPADAIPDKINHHAVERLDASGNKEIVNEEIIVSFHREIDGLQVENSVITAEVDSDNEIISLFMNWRDYKPYKEAAVKSADVAFEEFTKKHLRYKNSLYPYKVVVTDLTLRYYSQPAAVTEKYLQPVYVFEGYVQSGDTSVPFEPVYIPATIEQFDRIPGCVNGVCV